MRLEHYFRAGLVERGPKYQWRDGYSRIHDGAETLPWVTKREAQRDAKAHGGRAVFHETKSAAVAAVAR
jgi:hypothetical protein